MKVKSSFFKIASFKVGDGQLTSFWEDGWLDDTPLALQYPTLYNIVYRKEGLVAAFLGASPLNIQFRKALLGDKWTKWIHLVSKLMLINLTHMLDLFQWRLTTNGIFTIKSMYADLMDSGPILRRKDIWKTKIPSMTKVFMWFLQREVVLTKDNLAKRNWHGSKK